MKTQRLFFILLFLAGSVVPPLILASIDCAFLAGLHERFGARVGELLLGAPYRIERFVHKLYTRQVIPFPRSRTGWPCLGCWPSTGCCLQAGPLCQRAAR